MAMAMEEDLAGVGGASPPPPLSLAAEQRKKRLIKKREVGSRSRARKHAHLTKIQKELHQLLQENLQLRLKYDQLRASVEVSMPVPVPVPVPAPASKTLHRVLSANF